MKDRDHAEGRRSLLKALAAGGGVLAAASVLPGSWGKPIAVFSSLPAHAQTSMTVHTLNVLARVDGLSDLVVKGVRCHWFHQDYQAPGYMSDPELPTRLNGKKWYPSWPVPNPENCDCNSSSYKGIPRLAAQEQVVGLQVLEGRGDVQIVQQPAAGNDFTLIVRFDDNAQGGADWYRIRLTYYGE